MSNFGGFSGGFSQGGGGGGGGGGGNAGFFSSQFGNSQSGGDSPAGKKAGPAAQSLHTVTIKQLLDADHSQADQPFRVDNHDLSNITVIGIIRSVSEQSMFISCTIEDGTGSVSAEIWGQNDDPNGAIAKQRALLKEGEYVRVIGTLRATSNSRSIRAHIIRPITDHNAITQHFLKCIFIHLHYTRGPPPTTDGGSTGAPSGAAAAPALVQGYGAVPAGTEKLNPIQRQVLAAVKSNSANTDGMHVNAIARLIGVSPSGISEAIRVLTDDGLLYATVDDNHFNATDPN